MKIHKTYFAVLVSPIMCHACVFGASFPVYFGSGTGNKLQMHNIVREVYVPI